MSIPIGTRATAYGQSKSAMAQKRNNEMKSFPRFHLDHGRQTSMPSMTSDEPLRRRLEEVVATHDGAVSRTADALSLSRVFVWRFLRTGRAIPRNVERLKQALDAAGSLQASNDPERPKRKTKQKHPVHFSRSDIAKTRHLLQYLIAALDAYEVGDMNPDRAASSY